MTPTLEPSRYRERFPRGTPSRKKKNAYVAALRRDRFRCCRCGVAEKLTMHHRTPKAEGGRTVTENLETLCVGCHRKHHAVEEVAA